jgi:hypothetical protein
LQYVACFSSVCLLEILVNLYAGTEIILVVSVGPMRSIASEFRNALLQPRILLIFALFLYNLQQGHTTLRGYELVYRRLLTEG